eukprot:CAMPEP_0113686682 /NCGR_PEP_ID=MMETSP0038_2-20120614/15439_1 /TAXON_ID=2898 /ORGANISM="Cryptomonas paramecium" /LENGTH=144 /DNA_ID=CAMNT_0000607059 /DNA_START=134 /DNA_END=568 /DNA_ORIENTATION=+ /assembly_acc=CAM_ASM_000170
MSADLANPKPTSSSSSAAAAARPRAILCSTNVIYIMDSKGKATAATLARRYGVTEKAIRDIWRGRTWAKETSSIMKFKLSNEKPEKRRARSIPSSFDILPETPTPFSLIASKFSEFDVDSILAEWDQGRTVLPCVYDPYFGFMN